jgi:hypothetical protein
MKPPHAAAHNMAAIVQKSAKWELPKNMAQHVGRKDIMSKAIVVNKWCMRSVATAWTNKMGRQVLSVVYNSSSLAECCTARAILVDHAVLEKEEARQISLSQQ